MLLENIKSTFISKLIFSYITKEKYLGLIKYNKELQKRFDITKYDYLKLLIEKKYLNILKEKVLFKFIKEKIKNIDYKEFNNIIDQLSNEYSEEKCNFQFYKNNKDLLSIKNKIEIDPTIFGHIKELIINFKGEIKIPISVMKNIKSLCLRKVIINFKVDILDYKENDIILLNNIENLKLEEIYIKKDEKVKLSFPNLKYLDIESSEKFSFSFYIKNLGFNFAYIFFNKFFESFSSGKNYKDNLQRDIFNDKTFPKNLEYFRMNVEREIELLDKGKFCKESEEKKIIFTKNKNNISKYFYHIYLDHNTNKESFTESRYSKNQYNDYFCKKESIGFYGSYNNITNLHKQYDINEATDIKFGSIEFCYGDYGELITKTGKNFIKLFKSINSNNFILNSIDIEFIDFNLYPEFIDKIKFMKMLIKFKVIKSNISNFQLLNIFKNLSLLEIISVISIGIENIELKDWDKKQLINCFPKLEISTYNKISLIQYYDELYIEEKQYDLIEEKIYDNNDHNEEDDSDSIDSILINEEIQNEDICDKKNESSHSQDEEFWLKHEEEENDDDNNDDSEEETYKSGYKLNKNEKYSFRVEQTISDYYLSVWHLNKKHPKGYLLLSEYIDLFEIGYNKNDILKINKFEIKLEDGDNFFKIEKILSKILRLNEAMKNSYDITEETKWLEREKNTFHNLFDYLFLLIKKSK